MNEKKPSLSAAQQRAVSHIRGPALVIAGPGSGKTFVIVQRIFHLIQAADVPPEQILVLTYTKAAALQMQKRFQTAWRDAQREQPPPVRFGTFHSICYHILQQFGNLQANSLIKESDKRKFIEVWLKNNGMEELCSYDSISMLLSAISYEKNRFEKTPHGEKLPPHLSGLPLSAELYGRLQREYDCFLRAEGFLDFEDMILQCLRLLSQNQSARERCQEMFPYLLVDEFQDINGLQFEVLKLLALPQNHLFVVGDDDQSIYGFRGAVPHMMQLFRQEYPECRVFMLTENYRSGAEIVRFAARVIEKGSGRFAKEFIPVHTGGTICLECFQTRAEQERELLARLSALSPKQGRETAIIVRNNLLLMQYLQLLKHAQLPIAGGHASPHNLVKSPVFQDVFAFLNFVYDGKKRSDFLRFMNKPNHFFTRMALSGEQVRQEELLFYYQNNKEMQAVIHNYFAHLTMAEGLSPGLAVRLFRKTIGYERYLKEKAANSREYQIWEEQLTQVEEMAASLPSGRDTGKRLLDLAEERALPATSIYREGISVMTMHGAKGLEFDRVFLPDVNEGIIPGRQSASPEALEEERRLLYVAITRAKKELYLSYTKERGRELSRYLAGLLTPRPYP